MFSMRLSISKVSEQVSNKELLNLYSVSGVFYEAHGDKFRRLLRIQSKGGQVSDIDLLVIMMNPGSSKSNGAETSNIEVDCIPDPTQFQIMRVMQRTSRKHAVVLNLSDLRNAKSEEFYKRIPELEAGFESHSIFSAGRRKEIEPYLNPNIPVIIGWGVSRKLLPLSTKALTTLNGLPIFAMNNQEGLPLHPYLRYRQREWVETISTEILKKVKLTD